MQLIRVTLGSGKKFWLRLKKSISFHPSHVLELDLTELANNYSFANLVKSDYRYFLFLLDKMSYQYIN